jgi:hypothetical protein
VSFFGGFLAYALMCMLIQATNRLLNKELAKDFSGLVLARIAEAVLEMILINLDKAVKLGRLYPLKK